MLFQSCLLLYLPHCPIRWEEPLPVVLMTDNHLERDVLGALNEIRFASCVCRLKRDIHKLAHFP